MFVSGSPSVVGAWICLPVLVVFRWYLCMFLFGCGVFSVFVLASLLFLWCPTGWCALGWGLRLLGHPGRHWVGMWSLRGGVDAIREVMDTIVGGGVQPYIALRAHPVHR